jgi:biotin carboxyl carrier protein
VAAPAAGVVAELRAKAGEQVAAGQVLVVVGPCP